MYNSKILQLSQPVRSYFWEVEYPAISVNKDVAVINQLFSVNFWAIRASKYTSFSSSLLEYSSGSVRCKKRGQEYTKELYKKGLNDLDCHDGVITHLEPDILVCEVKQAWGSINTNKASGDDGIPVELFQILKGDAVKVLHSRCQQIWKTQQWPQDWKRSVFIQIPKKDNAKESSNYCTIALIAHTGKVMFKILQARMSRCTSWI